MKQLPVLNSSVLRPDGRREFVVPADVHGRFTRRRNLIFAALIALWIALPWLQIGGHPALFLDIEHRAFYAFGQVFNAQDFWMVFFLISGLGFVLIVTTALWGRVWCGYACPQTVFLDGVYRRVERWIEGPRNLRLRRDKSWTVDRLLRKVAKHAAFAVLSFLIAHIVLSYFVSLPNVLRYVRQNPAGHPEAFAWAFAMTAVLYVNFAWFREQLCLIICPYGRLQSVLTDAQTVTVAYDAKRGEPRKQADCVDCGRCVVVCPTGIDIRNGLQLECIACAACIDACDDVMARLKRPLGLIRYQSQRTGSWRRPRVYMYAALGVLGLVVATLTMRTREPFEANVLRLAGAPFVVEDGQVLNRVELHLINKLPARAGFTIRGEGDLQYTQPADLYELDSLAERRVPIFVRAKDDGHPRKIRFAISDGQNERQIEAPFVAPGLR